MLFEMTACAHRLGLRFAAEAERADEIGRRIEYAGLFERCFFAVRVGIALELRLERTPAVRPQPRDAACDREALIDREDLADRADRLDAEYDRERDRETERASFPILIRALEGVVADAAKLPGPPPAELLTLRELLAKVKAQPPAGLAPARKARRAAVGATLAPPTRHLASNVGQILAARRATGPPRP